MLESLLNLPKDSTGKFSKLVKDYNKRNPTTSNSNKPAKGNVGGNSGKGSTFSDRTKLDDHFERHGADFNIASPAEYEKVADNFLTGSKNSTTLERVRANGDVVRFDQTTNSFGVISEDGVIRTFYKPSPRSPSNPGGYNSSLYSSPLEYFNAQ